MPKGKKGKSERVRLNGFGPPSDDDSFENASVMSNYSENHSVDEEEVCDEFTIAQQEEKLADIIDGLTQKSSQGRANCYKMFTKSLIKKHMPSFCKERIFTLCDCMEKSFRKGIPKEICAAADLASVLSVQLGTDESCESICEALKPILLAMICDGSTSLAVRAKCCTSLADISFLSGGEIGEILTLMKQLETIFCGSYLKGDGLPPTVSPDLAILHAAAINSWSLLFTLMVPGNIGTMMNNSKMLPSLENLSELLESSHLDIRMAAGEAIVLVFELGREEDNNFADDISLKIIKTLKQLATDSHKYRAKKDRKQQRATFRDILQYIEDDRASEENIKIGKQTLLLDSWIKRKHYDSLCNILGPSINVHLVENDFLKDIFQIEGLEAEDRIPAYAQQQSERYRKKLLNAARDKKRTISRGRCRDKRSDYC